LFRRLFAVTPEGLSVIIILMLFDPASQHSYIYFQGSSRLGFGIPLVQHQADGIQLKLFGVLLSFGY